MRVHKKMIPGIVFSVAAALVATGAFADQKDMRFAVMDENDDGVITLREWQGHERSFKNHDWNDDGILSGDELKRTVVRDVDDLIGTDRFARLDLNGDGRIDAAEWPADRAVFYRLDRNEDRLLTHQEVFGFDRHEAMNRAELFDLWDHDRDDVLTVSEWHLDRTSFNLLDRNLDGFVTRAELDLERVAVPREDPAHAELEPGEDASTASFSELDADGNGSIERREWVGLAGMFQNMDNNNDERVVWAEWEALLSKRFDAADPNGDGIVTREEWEWGAENFDALDQNGDGVWTRSEFILRGDDPGRTRARARR